MDEQITVVDRHERPVTIGATVLAPAPDNPLWATVYGIVTEIEVSGEEGPIVRVRFEDGTEDHFGTIWEGRHTLDERAPHLAPNVQVAP